MVGLTETAKTISGGYISFCVETMHTQWPRVEDGNRGQQTASWIRQHAWQIRTAPGLCHVQNSAPRGHRTPGSPSLPCVLPPPRLASCSLSSPTVSPPGSSPLPFPPPGRPPFWSSAISGASTRLGPPRRDSPSPSLPLALSRLLYCYIVFPACVSVCNPAR